MAGIAIGLAFLSGFGAGAPAVVVCAGLAILAGFRGHVSTLLLMAVLIAAVGGALLAHREAARPLDSPPTGEYEGEVRVVDGSYLIQSGQRFTAATLEDSDGSLCVYAGSAPRVVTGDLLTVTGYVTRLDDLPEVGRVAVTSRGCSAQLRLGSFAVLEPGTGLRPMLSRARVELSELLMRAAPGDSGALLSGLVTGDDGGLSGDASDAFLATGTTHITAISGANFAMIVLLIGALATGAMRRSLAFVAGVSVVIWTYALLVGLQPSALRAALLASAVLLGRWVGRAPDLLSLTLLLAALQVLVRPHDFQTLAFQLSLAATIALVVVFDGRERAGGGAFATSLIMSVFAAQLATLPVLAMRLGAVSGTGLIANLLVSPLAALAFPLALVGGIAGRVSELLGIAALQPAILLAGAIIEIVRLCEDHLWSLVQLGEPTAAATIVLFVTCWSIVFWMSGDLRRMARHGREHIRSW